MKRGLWYLAAAAVQMWAMGLPPAYACDCGAYSREQAIGRAPTAFKGQVISTRRVAASDAVAPLNDPPVFISRVKVLYRLHGEPFGDEIEIFSGSALKTSCGEHSLAGSEGESFIFLGSFRRGEPGSTGPCALLGVTE